jgi:hypothetical protein
VEGRSKEFLRLVDVQYALLFAALHIYTSCHSFYYPKMAESLTECCAAYDFKLVWVDEIYERGIEQTAKGDRRDRMYYIGKGYTPKERGLTFYWEPTYELSSEVGRDTMFEKMPNMKWRGFQLMALEKEGCEYVPVVEVRINCSTATCSLIAAKNFARGDVVTVLSLYEAKMKKKVLIFGGRCAEPGDGKTEEGGKAFNAMITPSHTIRCNAKIRRGEEIVVNYEVVYGDPINFLDRVVRSRYKGKSFGRIVAFAMERTGVVLDVKFEGEEKIRKCRRGEVSFVYLR